MNAYGLKVKKDRLGFAAAHFTLFPDGTAERLHGHNYKTEFELEGASIDRGLLVDFSDIKRAAARVCDELDERTLLPTQHPDLKVERGDGWVRASFKEKTYTLPDDDVHLLPVENTTVEELARFFCNRLLEELGSRLEAAGVTRLRVGIEETPGQCGYFEVSL